MVRSISKKVAWGVQSLLLSLALCSTGTAQAVLSVSNPVGWTLNQDFPNPVYTGSLYSVTYTLTNRMRSTMVHPLEIQKKASPAIEFTYLDQCTGKQLRPNQNCTVQITLNPVIAGDKFVQFFIAGYDDNVVPLPQLATFANASMTTGTVVGTPKNGLPAHMNVNSSSAYVFQFNNYSSLPATLLGVSIQQSSGTPSYVNHCTGSLAPGGVCYVTGTYTPTSSSPIGQEVQASLSYTGPTGSPAVTSTSTIMNGGTPGGAIVGSVSPAATLPALMTPGQSITGTPGGIEFLFTNTSSDTLYYFPTGLTPTVILTWSDSVGDSGSCPSAGSDSTPACTITQNNCIASLPDSFAQCSVYANFTSPTGAASSPPITYTLTSTLSYSAHEGGPYSQDAQANTAASVIATLPTQRVIKMVNRCDFAIGYSLNGGAVGGGFWQNYTGSTNGALPADGIDYVIIPANDVDGVQWSGNISAMTGCDQSGPNTGKNCTLSVCGNSGTGPCAPGVGFNQPATQVEITMLTQGVDSYDGEVINGFSLPVSMAPYAYIDPLNAANDIPATPNGYSCGTPAKFTASNGFGACDWGLASAPTTPDPAFYYFVGGGSGESCSGTSPCHSSTEICGLSQTTPNAAISERVCGYFQGYWTPDELCGQSTNLPADISAALQCNTKLPSTFNLATDPYGNTYTSLMACYVTPGYTGPVYASCYTTSYTGVPPASPQQCCGCVDWWDQSQTIGNVTIDANVTSQTCPLTHVDPYWTSYIQEGVQWLKKACPSVYVYPFDDTTSKFTCTNNTQTGTNTTSYVVTFCEGNSGLPANKTDGRA